MPAAGTRTGLAAAVAAAIAFSTSGILLKPLLDAGWSPAAAVAVRVALGGLVLAPAALIALRGSLRPVLQSWKLVLGYGLIAVAGTQVLYFAAIQRLPIAVALLVQYSAPVMLAVLGWATRRVPVRPIVVAGVVLSVVGLVLVVGVGGIGQAGGLDAAGIALALAAAVCLAGYYVLSAVPTPGLPPLALVSSGLIVGAVATVGVGLTGLLPLAFSTGQVELGGITMSWWEPVLVVALVATAAAYSLSIAGSRRLGARIASFAGLTEVVSAVILAWLLLGEQPDARQLAGGACIIAGVVLVRLERTTDASASVRQTGTTRAGLSSPSRSRKVPGA
ncbi:EamA family transporter [Leifsonia sp. TF02-11]|nr:EamA family transporter [Leifsonia sp. TF02-11]